MKSTKKNQKNNMPKNAIGDTEILNLTVAPEIRNEPPRNGLCADMGPQIFFPFTLEEQSGPEFRKKYIESRSHTQTAKEMCHRCHVINECFAYSVHYEKYGIWAGLTERQRQTIRRKLKIKLIQREPINMIPGMNLR